MDWPRILAYITGTVDQELLLRNEYLVAENRILREQVNGRLLLSDAEKKTLAEIGYRLGRKTLEDVANAAKSDTILGWYRKLVAQKFDGSKARRKVGRPQVDDDIEQLIVRMARENPSWGYDRIVGALANLGHRVSDQTVGNVLRRHGIAVVRNNSRRGCSRRLVSKLIQQCHETGSHGLPQTMDPKQNPILGRGPSSECLVQGLAGSLSIAITDRESEGELDLRTRDRDNTKRMPRLDNSDV
jgi:hypothetical protein